MSFLDRLRHYQAERRALGREMEEAAVAFREALEPYAAALTDLAEELPTMEGFQAVFGTEPLVAGMSGPDGYATNFSLANAIDAQGHGFAISAYPVAQGCQCHLVTVDYNAGEPGTELPDDAVQARDIEFTAPEEMIAWVRQQIETYIGTVLADEPGLTERFQRKPASGLVGRMFGR